MLLLLTMHEPWMNAIEKQGKQKPEAKVRQFAFVLFAFVLGLNRKRVHLLSKVVQRSFGGHNCLISADVAAGIHLNLGNDFSD